MLDRERIGADVIRLLRRRALAGSSREVPLDAPLGESGLGLDSLAMVDFITSLEKTFGVEFPDDVWVERDKFTPVKFAEMIMSLRPVGNPLPQAARELEQPVDGAPMSLSHLFRKATARVYARERYFILAFDLMNGEPHHYRCDLNLTLKEASPGDKSSLSAMWGKDSMERKLALFEKRLASGCICLTVWHQDQIVGIDWLSATGDEEPCTGLAIRMNPGSCYGFDLNEDPRYEGKGVGLATLAFSLAVAKERRFKTQFTLVHSGNRRMLGAAVQIFGFKHVGTIETTRILGRVRSSWEFEGRRGDSLVLQL